MPMEQALAELQWNGRVSSMIATTISLVALCLAAVGLYAVTMHAVSERTQEIGVRMALGARTSHVVGIVARRVARQLAFGLAAGAACTLPWGRLFGDTGRTNAVQTADLLNLAAASLVLVVVAAIAAFVPAWRAARVDPVIALRYE